MSKILKIFFVVLPIIACWFCNYTEENLHKTNIKYCMKKFDVHTTVMNIPGVVNNGDINKNLYNHMFDRVYEDTLKNYCSGFSSR